MKIVEVHGCLIAAAREAGKVALRHFKSDGLKTVLKPDGTPVTSADLAVNACLAQQLRSSDPDVGWLSEETADSPDRLSKSQVWIVDPIDGTRSFAVGGSEWVISLAFVVDGAPVAAVLFRPITGDLYDAFLLGGARLNGCPIRVRDGDLSEIKVFTGPQRAMRHLAPCMRQAEWLRSPPSLALRLARLAQGAIDVALVKDRSWDWDIAAADLIVSEAGGLVTSRSHARPVYNRPDPRHPELVGAGIRRHGALLSALAGAQPWS